MKKVILLFSLLSLLGSCTSSSSTTSSSKDYDDNLPYFQLNGDILPNLNKSDIDYEDITRDTTINDVIDKIRGNEAVFLYLYQTTCSHCSSFKPHLFSYIKQDLPEIYTFNIYSLKDLNPLINAFPAYREAFDGLGTPSIYFFESETKYSKINFYDYMNNPIIFRNFITSKYNQLTTVSVRTYEGLMKAIDKYGGLIYKDIHIENEYTGRLFPLVKQSRKSLIRVETHFLSDEDQTKIDALFGTSTFLLKNDSGVIQYNYSIDSQQIKDYFTI